MSWVQTPPTPLKGDIMEDEMDIIYRTNKRLIEKYNLKVGCILTHKTELYNIKIVFIHSLYGWVITEWCNTKDVGKDNLKQDMRNINDFIIVRHITEIGENKYTQNTLNVIDRCRFDEKPINLDLIYELVEETQIELQRLSEKLEIFCSGDGKHMNAEGLLKKIKYLKEVIDGLS